MADLWPASSGRPADGRLRLLAAAERLLATRGLQVPVRAIIDAAGQHNQSAVSYHFGSRAGLIDAVRERHEAPVAAHRQHLLARLPGPDQATTRQLADAYIQPLAAEMLRCTPSHWARLAELLKAHEPYRRADAAAGKLTELITVHLGHLPEPEAACRVTLTTRFIDGALACWERDSEADPDGVMPLASFALTLTDLAVALLQAPSSAPDLVALTPQAAGG